MFVGSIECPFRNKVYLKLNDVVLAKTVVPLDTKLATFFLG